MENESAWSRAIERARQRQADRLGHGSTADLSSTSERVDAGRGKSTAETEAAFQIMINVANNLYEDDPRTTANNITKLKLLSRATRDFVEEIPLGEFHTKLNEAGSAAKDVHEKTYPKNGLPEARPDPDDDLAPVPAGDLISAVGPNLKLLSDKTKSAIVGDVHNISNPDAKADAIAALVGYRDLELKDRTSLIDEAIVFFGEEGELHTFRRGAATEAIAKAYKGLDVDHHRIIDGLRAERPEIGKLLDSHIDKFEAKSIAARATHIDRAIEIIREKDQPYFVEKDACDAIAKAEKLTNTRKPILEDLLLAKKDLGYALELSRLDFRGNLRERLDRASCDRSLLESERVEKIRSISVVIPDKLQLAQKKFINSTRSRARSYGR